MTRLMWLVQTYLDHPTIFHVNWLNLARSRDTDRENGYENRSPVFSHERCPNNSDLDNLYGAVMMTKSI